MKQCHVVGLVKYELQSMIKGNGHYAVMGVYSPLEVGKHALTEDDPLLLPRDTEEKASKVNLGSLEILLWSKGVKEDVMARGVIF